MTIHIPTTEIAAADIIRTASSPLSIQGGGSKLAFGRPASGDILSSKGLTGITLYEPSEMVISARSGTPLSEIEAVVAAKGQMLPFEPMDFSLLFGEGAPTLGGKTAIGGQITLGGETTVGGVAACNLSGPRRIQSGAARDSILGLRFINGNGELVKTGGRVMKNVTGLDLVKINCGAFGTLAFLTEVTLKLLPVPQKAVTLVIKGLSDAEAIAALSTALGSPFEISGAAHLPSGLGRDISRTLMRLENFEASISYRVGELRKIFDQPSNVNLDVNLLEGEDSDRLWRGVRDVEFLCDQPINIIWKISCAPSNGPKIMAALKPLGGKHFYDWGGGLIWLSLDSPHTGAVRAAVARFGGYATLVRAPENVRATAAVFQPLAAPLLALTKSVKASFDPRGILNFGRMFEGV